MAKTDRTREKLPESRVRVTNHEIAPVFVSISRKFFVLSRPGKKRRDMKIDRESRDGRCPAGTRDTARAGEGRRHE
jgi:hypothetical protein